MADKQVKTKKPAIPLSKEEKKAIKKRISEINAVYGERSVQNVIPYSDMTKDGICVVPKRYFGKSERKNFYSKMMKFGGINYRLAANDDQSNIFGAYSEILNYFDDEVWFQLTFENRKRDNKLLLKQLIVEKQADEFDEIRNEYSDMLCSKLTEGDNVNELVKFITFGVFAKNTGEARTKLNLLAGEVISLFKRSKVEAEPVSGEERLSVLYRALNPYKAEPFLFDWDYCRKIGSNTKDYISPPSMYFEKNNFEIGDCYGQAVSVSLIASEIKDRILYDFLDENQLFCVNIHVKPFDILTGQKLVQNALLNVKAMKSDKLQKQAAAGMFGGELPGGMQESIDELTELLQELKSKDEKLFQISLTIRAYAKTKKGMKGQQDLLRRICQKNSCILIPCDYSQEDVLCASLPLGVSKILNKRAVHTSGLAAFMPFTSRELFHIHRPRASYYGINALTHNMILVDKSTLKNPNSLFPGTPGAGKSFAVKREAADVFLKTLDDIFICDPEGGISRL